MQSVNPKRAFNPFLFPTGINGAQPTYLHESYFHLTEVGGVREAVAKLHLLQLFFSQIKAAGEEAQILAITHQKFTVVDSLNGRTSWGLSNQIF